MFIIFIVVLVSVSRSPPKFYVALVVTTVLGLNIRLALFPASGCCVHEGSYNRPTGHECVPVMGCSTAGPKPKNMHRSAVLQRSPFEEHVFSCTDH